MLPQRLELLKAVRARRWTIQDAWSLISESSALGFHPDTHVILPELHSDSQAHFLSRTDFRGGEYRDRGRHSLFRNAWEAAGATCAALNTAAGENALNSLLAGQVELISRSALIGSSYQLERLQLEFQGATTGVSYFEKPVNHVVFVFVCKNDAVGLKTMFPVSGPATSPNAGFDVVRQRGFERAFPACT